MPPFVYTAANELTGPLAFLPPIGFSLFFVVLWTSVCALLRRLAGMKKELGFDPGPIVRESGWGSARIRGVNFNNCLKISEHRDGWLLRTMWLFGGGKRWLPRSATTIGELKRGFLSKSRELTVDGRTLLLYGNLAETIRDSSAES